MGKIYRLFGPVKGRQSRTTVVRGRTGMLTDRQECKGHVIKKTNFWKNQSNIKDFNSKSLTPSEMMKSQTSPNCLVNHSQQQKEENINKG